MAEKFEVSQSTYARWEESTDPDLDTLLALAEYFKVPFGDFITKKLEHKDIPPRWGSREYPKQEQEAQAVNEPSREDELMAKVLAKMEELEAGQQKLRDDIEAMKK